MPRSADGRWIVKCKLCGKTFNQRRKSQEFCSQDCSNKAFPGKGGRKPAAGLEPRTCIVCGEQFQPYRDNSITCSQKCYRETPSWREAQRRQDARPERQARKNELRRGSESVRRYNRKVQLARYGITVEQHGAMLEAQNGLCAICAQPPDPNGVRATSRLHTDHDHLTGKVRSLLCNNCNRGLGCFADDPSRLRAAAEYIESHRSREG